MSPLPDQPPTDVIDWTPFSQILEMDDDEDREFSTSIIVEYFAQTVRTFASMDKAIEAKDLQELSQLGHFLKGSSAVLGVTKVQNSCEKIQHLGAKLDETGTNELADEDECLKRIKATLEVARKEYEESQKYLKEYCTDEEAV